MKLRWHYALNFLVLQWFFIRLVRFAPRDAPMITVGWGLMLFVVPLTGWWSDFIPAKPYLLTYLEEED